MVVEMGFWRGLYGLKFLNLDMVLWVVVWVRGVLGLGSPSSGGTLIQSRMGLEGGWCRRMWIFLWGRGIMLFFGLILGLRNKSFCKINSVIYLDCLRKKNVKLGIWVRE